MNSIQHCISFITVKIQLKCYRKIVNELYSNYIRTVKVGNTISFYFKSPKGHSIVLHISNSAENIPKQCL